MRVPRVGNPARWLVSDSGPMQKPLGQIAHPLAPLPLDATLHPEPQGGSDQHADDSGQAVTYG